MDSMYENALRSSLGRLSCIRQRDPSIPAAHVRCDPDAPLPDVRSVGPPHRVLRARHISSSSSNSISTQCDSWTGPRKGDGSRPLRVAATETAGMSFAAVSTCATGLESTDEFRAGSNGGKTVVPRTTTAGKAVSHGRVPDLPDVVQALRDASSHAPRQALRLKDQCAYPDFSSRTSQSHAFRLTRGALCAVTKA